jgi:hypothetical protein
VLEEYLHKLNPWWSQKYSPPGIERGAYLDQLTEELSTPDIAFLMGLRRVGKTTIMKQLVSRAIRTYGETKVFYCSLDHPAFSELSILDILREFRKEVGAKSGEKVLLLLDEVQMREHFEVELKAIHDSEPNVKVVASGSSSLTVRHKAPYLTGRHRDTLVQPLGYAEFLAFRGLEVSKPDNYLNEKYLGDYLHTGGLPQFVLTGDPESVLTLVDDIVYKDIAGRYPIRNPAVLKDLLLLLSQRIGQRVSYNKLAKLMGFTPDTIKQYVGLFEESFLFHTVPKYGTRNEQVYAPKKLYAADNGIASVLAADVTEGALAENLIYNELRERGKVCYLMVGAKEVDFVVGGEVLEVKYKGEVEPKDVALLARLKIPNIRSRTLVTKDRSDTRDGVNTIPLWRFLQH